MAKRQHTRLSRSNVEIESPLFDCHLLDLSTSGLGVETSIGLRLGVPYPFRLRDGAQIMSIEAVVRWCRLVRTETVDGESRPVFRAGASFVDWQVPNEPEVPASDLEHEIDQTLDGWMEKSRTSAAIPSTGRTIVHRPLRS